MFLFFLFRGGVGFWGRVVGEMAVKERNKVRLSGFVLALPSLGVCGKGYMLIRRAGCGENEDSTVAVDG